MVLVSMLFHSNVATVISLHFNLWQSGRVMGASPQINNIMELPFFLFLSSRRKYGRLFHWSLKKNMLLPLLQTLQVISAKFAICFLEYIELVYFSLTTFSQACFVVFFPFVVVVVLFFVFFLFFV